MQAGQCSPTSIFSIYLNCYEVVIFLPAGFNPRQGRDDEINYSHSTIAPSSVDMVAYLQRLLSFPLSCLDKHPSVLTMLRVSLYIALYGSKRMFIRTKDCSRKIG